MAWIEMWRPRILVCGLVIALTSLLSHCTGFTVTVSKSYIGVKPMENTTLTQGVVEMQTTDDVRRGWLILGGRNFRPIETFSSVDGALKSSNGALEIDADYQSDMVWDEPEQLEGKVYGTARPDKAAVERLMQMEPTVECDEDSMKFSVRGMASTLGPLLCVDGENLQSPMPLSLLPASCGYTVRSTRRDMTFVAPYDGCHVTLEEGNHVLPLCWLGLQMRMCCPATKPSPPKPPTVSCYPGGMVVKIKSATSEEISVKFNGQWHPLMTVSPRCGFSVVAHPEGVVISAHYEPCVETKDGMFSLEMAFGGEMKLSCPGLPDINPSTEIPTPSRPVDPETLSKPIPSNQGPVNPEPAQPVPDPNYPNPWGLYPPFPKPVPHQVPPQTPDTMYPEPSTSGSIDPGTQPYPKPPKPAPTRKPPKPAPTPKPPKPAPTPSLQKPTAAAEAPKGQVNELFDDHFFNFQPQEPETYPIQKPYPGADTPKGQVNQPWYPYPFYPQPAEPQTPTDAIQKPTPPAEAPKGEVQPPFYPYPFYPLPEKPETSPTQKPSPSTDAPKGEVQPPFYPYPFYPLPEKPEMSPTQKPAPPTDAPKGQVNQPWYPYPFYPLPEKPETSPTQKPSPYDDAPKGQVNQPWYPYPFYPLPEKPETSPTQKPAPPTDAPKGQVNQPWYPYPFYPQPAEPQTPTDTTIQMPTPPAEAPKREVQPPFYPFYPLPEKPETSPTQKPAPPTDVPKGQVNQPWYPYPFYPQPAEPQTPTDTTIQMPTPPAEAPAEAPKRVVQPPFYPFYPLPEKPETSPTQKPAPPTDAPKGQVNQPWYPYPFYPQPAEPQTPTDTTIQMPTPPAEAPKRVVQPPFYPFYPLPEKPETSPTQKPAPPTDAPKGQVNQPWYPYPFYPQPAEPQTPTDTTIQMPTPPAEAPKREVQPPFYPFYPLPEKPETSPTQKPSPYDDAPKGQVNQPWYHYPLYPQPPKPQPLPTPKPSLPMPEIPVTASQKPTPVTGPPNDQLYPYFYPYPSYPQQPQNPKPVTIPSTDNQPPPPFEPMPTESPKPVKPIPTVQLETQRIPYPPGYCPPACPPGFSNCCLPQGYCPPTCPPGFSNCCHPPISFHQHYHHTVPAGSWGGGGVPNVPIYPAAPFMPNFGYLPDGSSLSSLTPNPTEPATEVTNEPAATPPATGDSNKAPAPEHAMDAYFVPYNTPNQYDKLPPIDSRPSNAQFPLEPPRQPIGQGYNRPPTYLSDQAPATDLFSVSGAQPHVKSLKPKTPPPRTHGKPQLPPNKPVKQLGDVLRAYSKRHSGVKKQNSPGQERPAHASPLYNPAPNRHSPQPFQHYWKPIMARGSFRKVPISHLTQPS